MALQQIDRSGLRSVWKRRVKNQRRVRRMERALRWNLYLHPLADLVAGLGRIAEAVARTLRGH